MNKFLLIALFAIVFYGCQKETIKSNDMIVNVTYGVSYFSQSNLMGAKVYLYKGIGSRIEDYTYMGGGIIKNEKTGDQPNAFKTEKTDYFGKAEFDDLDGVVYAFVVDISALVKDYPLVVSYDKRFTYLTSLSDNSVKCYFSMWPYSTVNF